MPVRSDDTPMPDVKEIREKLGLNQAELAELVGVNQTSVSHWEQKKRRPSRAAQILLEQLFSRIRKKGQRRH
jgi:DNA-binding transcriptional regulator YiaG